MIVFMNIRRHHGYLSHLASRIPHLVLRLACFIMLPRCYHLTLCHVVIREPLVLACISQ
jgi:hypothetical protein